MFFQLIFLMLLVEIVIIIIHIELIQSLDKT